MDQRFVYLNQSIYIVQYIKILILHSTFAEFLRYSFVFLRHRKMLLCCFLYHSLFPSLYEERALVNLQRGANLVSTTVGSEAVADVIV